MVCAPSLGLLLLVAIMLCAACCCARCAPAPAADGAVPQVLRDDDHHRRLQPAADTSRHHHQRHHQQQQQVQEQEQEYRGASSGGPLLRSSAASENRSNSDRVSSAVEDAVDAEGAQAAAAAAAAAVAAAAAARSERSANLSHTTGVARKIQFFIKNFHLQILPDGTVNGTLDDSSIYTILQRTAVGIGKLKIQGVGTCQYLCMDTCGLLYGSREFNDECVFNEMIQQHHYNTYSSTKYSNAKRTLYLAFNRRGSPRKVLLHAGQPLGRLSSYTRVLTRTVPAKKMEELQHPMRHHAQHVCPSAPTGNPVQPVSGPLRCRRHKKRKKKKRKCPPTDDPAVGSHEDDDACGLKRAVSRRPIAKVLNAPLRPLAPSGNSSNHRSISNSSVSSKCGSDESDECQRASELPPGSSKRKTSKFVGGAKKKMAAGKGGGGRKRARMTTTTPPPTTTILDYSTDEDYALEATPGGATDWDEATATPLPDEPGNAHPD